MVGKNNKVTILSFNKTKLKDVISTYLKTKTEWNSKHCTKTKLLT